MAESLAFRHIDDEDRAFVVTKWMESFKYAHGAGVLAMGPWSHGSSMYFDVSREIVNALMARPHAETIVAYRPGEDRPFDLYGFVCVERGYPYPKRGHGVDVIHYLFVDQPYRRVGLARALLEEAKLKAPVIYTHMTAAGQVIAKKRGYTFDPHCARFGAGETE